MMETRRKYGWTVDTLSICVHLVLLFNDLSLQGWQGRNQKLYSYCCIPTIYLCYFRPNYVIDLIKNKLIFYPYY